LGKETYRNLIAVTALLHDIGKFIRRSGLGSLSHQEESKNFLEKHMEKFETKNLFTHEELELIKRLIENHHNIEKINKSSAYSDVENNLLKILIYSDWDSASERRQEKETSSSQEYVPIHSMLSFINEAFDIDEALRQGKEDKVFQHLSYVKAFLPQDAFVYEKPELDSAQPVVEYNQKRFENFESEFKTLIDESENQYEFVLRLNYILKRHSTYITSSGKERLRDISLYHHSATTAMFAINRLIDFEHGEQIKQRKQYGAVYGRLFKIQDYIFSGINTKIEKPLKRIITRSQLVSILNMIIPYDIVKTLDLYPFNIIFYGGGAFLILIPLSYISKAQERIKEIKKAVDEIFESKIYFEAICDRISVYENGYVLGNELKRLGEKLSEKKFTRSFDTIASFIHEKYFEKAYFKCENCKINSSKTILSGENFVCRCCQVEEKWMNEDITKLKFLFDRLYVENIQNPELLSAGADSNSALVLTFSQSEAENRKCIDIFLQGRKFIYTADLCQRCPEYDDCAEPYKHILSEEDERLTMKLASLDCLEKMSDSDNIIATAKMDIDDLGFILYSVYPIKVLQNESYPFSITRLSYASWLLNLFFTEGVKKVINEKFKDDVMILYSGGDDLLLTGVWYKVIEAIDEIEKEFSQFVTGKVIDRKNVTVTASIYFHRAHENFDSVLIKLNEGLEEAKKIKNRVFLFDNVISYPELRRSLDISKKIVDYVNEKVLGKLIIRKLLRILEWRKLRNCYQEIKATSQYVYLKTRLIENNKNLSEDKKKEVIEFLDSFMSLHTDNSNVSMAIVAINIALRKLIKESEE